MDNIKDLVKENLIRLRKEHKLTQYELSQKINYSDKAISRWETGEVTPDVETLHALALLYEIPLASFFEPPVETLFKEELKKKKKQDKEARRREKEAYEEASPRDAHPVSHLARWLAIFILSLLVLWSVVLCVFFSLRYVRIDRSWLTFIWALPLTALACLLFFRKHSRVMRMIFTSLLTWTLILSVYLQLLSLWNLFPLFICGVPIQALILLLPLVRAPAKKESIPTQEPSEE